MSEIRYKLTDQDGYTHNRTRWQPGATYTTRGQGELCGPGWLHCYSDPVLAIMMNPSHANFANPRLAEVICSGQCKQDHGLKEGWTTMAFSRWLPVPSITVVQRVAFGILCAKKVTTDPAWNQWADNWLAAQTGQAMLRLMLLLMPAYAYAAYATTAATDLDLVALAHQALKYK